jgi:hypothetical protein
MATKNKRTTDFSPLFKWFFNGLKSVVLLLFLTGNSFAQTLHAVVFADTDDRDIGESVAKDFYSMSIEMNTIASAVRMPIEEHFYYGEDFRNPKFVQTLEGLNIGAEDIVLVYVSSHGARPLQDACAYPQIAFPPKRDTDFFSLCQIDKILARKKPKFYLIMGDLCNSYSNALSAKELPKGNTVIKGSTEATYQALFSQVRGSVIVTSSQAGETSIALERGGAFTLCFLHSLQAALASGKADWNELLGNSKYCTQEVVKRNPVFEVRVQAAGNSTPVVVQQETTPHRSDDFMESVRRLADSSRGEEWRIKNASTVLQSHFAPNARVEVVGKNGTTVVATETADKFLRRLSTSFKLTNIVALESEKNSQGKIVSLKVHEIYRQ